MDDPYLHLIYAEWDKIIMMYETFQDKKPIVEYEIDTQKIYAYPAKEYINSLSMRTRDNARKQYEEANENNQFMLFIRDNENKKLRSYIFNLPN